MDRCDPTNGVSIYPSFPPASASCSKSDDSRRSCVIAFSSSPISRREGSPSEGNALLIHPTMRRRTALSRSSTHGSVNYPTYTPILTVFKTSYSHRPFMNATLPDTRRRGREKNCMQGPLKRKAPLTCCPPNFSLSASPCSCILTSSCTGQASELGTQHTCTCSSTTPF